MRWQRVLSAAAGLVLLAGLSAPGAANPPVVLAAAYTYNCAHPIPYDHQETVARGAGIGGTGSDYHAVIGDATVQVINTCTIPDQHGVATYVLPANLQSSASINYIVQLGWAKCVVPGGETCGDATYPIPNDGNIHFMYVCHDDSGGVPCNADIWAGAAIVGRRYRFRLEHTSSGTWKYSLTDYTANVTYTKSITAHWSLGDGAWWGAEAYDVNSMLGPTSTGGQFNMYWMQYLRNATGSNWQVAEPVTVEKCQLDLSINPPPCTGSWPSYFRSKVYSVNYTNDAIQEWTVAH